MKNKSTNWTNGTLWYPNGYFSLSVINCHISGDPPRISKDPRNLTDYETFYKTCIKNNTDGELTTEPEIASTTNDDSATKIQGHVTNTVTMSTMEQGEMTTLHVATTKVPVSINAITDSPSTQSIDETTTTENQMETSSTAGKVTTTSDGSGSGSGHKDHTTSAYPNEVTTSSGSGQGEHTTSAEPEETSVATTDTEQTTSAQPEDTTAYATTEKVQTTSALLQETTSDDRTTDVDKTSAQHQATTSESKTTNIDRSTTDATTVETTSAEVQSTERSLVVEETTTTGILSTPDTNGTCPQCLCMCSCKAEPPNCMTTPNWPNSTTVAENMNQTTSNKTTMGTTIEDKIESTVTPVGTSSEIEETTETTQQGTTSKVQTTEMPGQTTTTENMGETSTTMCTCVEDLTTELKELVTTIRKESSSVDELTTEALKNLTSTLEEIKTKKPISSEHGVTTEMPRTTGGDGMNATSCPEYTCPTVTVEPCTIQNQFISSVEDGVTTEMPRTTRGDELNATRCPVCTCPTVMPFSCPTQFSGADGKISTGCPTVLPCICPDQFTGTDGEATTASDIQISTDDENIMTTESVKVKHKLTRKAFVKMIKEFREMIDDTADSCPVPCPKAECNATSENKSQPATTPESPTFDVTSCPECNCGKNEAHPTVMTDEITTKLTTNQTDMFTTAGKKEYYTIKKKKRPVIVHEPLDLTDVKRAEEADYGPMIGSCFLVIVLAEVAFMVFLDLISIKMHIDMIKQNLGLV